MAAISAIHLGHTCASIDTRVLQFTKVGVFLAILAGPAGLTLTMVASMGIDTRPMLTGIGTGDNAFIDVVLTDFTGKFVGTNTQGRGRFGNAPTFAPVLTGVFLSAIIDRIFTIEAHESVSTITFIGVIAIDAGSSVTTGRRLTFVLFLTYQT